MKRALILLAAAVASLVAADALLQRREDSLRATQSLLLPLAPSVSSAAVAMIDIGMPPSGFHYELKDGRWRMPAYRNAYVLPDLAKALISGLIPGQGTVVSTNKKDLAHYGLAAGRTLPVRLSDSSGKKLLDISVGRGVPGSAASEAYVHVSGTKAITLLRFNPRAVVVPTLGPQAPPMIDPNLLTKAFPRRGVARVTFSGLAKYPITEIHMVFLSTGPPMPPKPGEKEKETIQWRARTRDGSVHVLDPGNAGSYAGYLERLRYVDILPAEEPAARDFAVRRGTLGISDDEGSDDVLEIGGDIEGNRGTLVRSRRAGLVYVIDSRKLPLFFPPLAALKGKENIGPIFQQAEPYGGMNPDPSAVDAPAPGAPSPSPVSQ